MFMGVTMSQPMETCTPKYKFSILVAYIHIGVGSNVVCSTTIGSARASIRGTDNKQFPRFFMLASIIENRLAFGDALGIETQRIPHA